MTSVATKKVSTQQIKVTPAVLAKAEDILRKAKVQLAIHQPFFAQIVFGRKIAFNDRMPTACINKRGHITIGTGFFSQLNIQQGVFLLAHEAMHYAMIHLFRRAFREPGKWNRACDAVINDLLTTNNVGEFIEGGVNMPGSRDKCAEKVFDELPDDAGDGPGGYQPGTGNNDMDDSENISDAEMREIEQQARQEVAQAAQAAKMRGTLPAGIEKIIEDIINPPTPWHILLERHMTKFVKSGLTWMRPNRRLLAHNIYMPTTDRIPKMGPVAIFRDTSGSCMSPDEQAHFLGHINSIMEKCRPERMYVIDCDAAVHAVHEYTLEDLPIKPAAKGGGGTSFKPPFEYVAEHGLEIECAVYLTDMYGDFPEQAPTYNTVWLSTSDVKEAPFGDVIRYQVTEK